VELLSEEEQWEQLKRWLRENGPSILVMVILGLLAVAGWRWWQSRGEQSQIAAGVAFENILKTFDSGKGEEALAQIEQLRKDYPKSGYVASADLAAARVFVARNELDKAVERLQRVTDSAVDVQLRPIARLRLARVQAAQGKHDLALTTLGAISAADVGKYQAAYTETRGDILLSKGDRAGALREYQAARKLQPPDQPGSSVAALLDLKINDLRPVAAAPAPAPVKAPAAP
jgi:predicted negative regulator of RcsB-dependent stress response